MANRQENDAAYDEGLPGRQPPDLRAQPPGADSRDYNLEERTAKFAEAIVRFAKKLPVNPVTRDLITQMVNAGTSVGANYCEATDGVSRKDFRNRIGFCKKEAKETAYWLRVVATAIPEQKDEARVLWKEATELKLIFAKSFRTSS